MTKGAAVLNASDIDWGQAATPAERQSDAQWAERFAEAQQHVLRYLHARQQWFLYQPPRWQRDTDGAVVRRFIAFVRKAQAEALQLPDRKAREVAVKDAISRESKVAIDRTLAIARNLPPLTDSGAGWDAEPFLWVATNTVVDVQTGTARPSDPALKVTLAGGVPLVPDATCPRWRQFLEEVFDGDRDLIAFVQRFVGYCLSGLTSEQVFALLYGTGANGKTTFLKILAYVFGEYATNLPFSALEQRGRSAIPNDIAALVGRRLATASETSEGTRLNEARLKALTGSDTVSARFLYQEKFDFQPTAHLILAVNHKPIISDDSYGFWRRLLLIPFVRSFTGSARDPQLEDRLRAEGSGILRWAIDGCLTWQRDGLNPPDSVLHATARYQEESDPLADFLAEAADLDREARTGASAVQAAYQKWCDLRSISKLERLTARALSQRMADRFPRRHTKTGWVYEGLRLAADRLF